MRHTLPHPPASRSLTSRPRSSAVLVLAWAVLAGLLLTGCSAQDSGSDASTAEAGPVDANTVEAGAVDAGAVEAGAIEAGAIEAGAIDANTLGAGDSATGFTPDPARVRSVISTGTVSLRDADVGAARFEVQKVADEAGGQIAEEETETDADGEVHRSRVVLRVPSRGFETAMSALAQIGDLVRTTRSAEDVTTQVIDTEARVRAQAAGLKRIEELLGRADSLKDIVAIERQLTDRRAELDSLRSQQAWLSEQTTLATITVHLERTDEDEEEPEKNGFLVGLSSGWSALVALTSGLVTALGAALPFAVPAALIGCVLVVLRRRRRRAAGVQTS